MITETLIKWLAIAYFFVLFAYVHYHFLRMKKWPWVSGQLVDIQSARPTGVNIGEVSALVAYVYEVKGVRYTGNRLSPLCLLGNVETMLNKQVAKIEYLSKGEVKVFYNPKNPKKSYLVLDAWYDIFHYLFGKK